MLSKKAILIGYSGHGIVVVETAISMDIEIVGYTELKEISYNPYGLAYLGFEMAPDFKEWESEGDFILGIGDNHIRHRIGRLIQSKGKKILNLIHSDASVTKMLTIGSGNFIARNSAINPLVEIGDFCIINTGAIIEHECVLQNAVHIAPGAVLAGNVQIGNNTFVGANAVVKQGVRIGENVVIGAGSVILHNISDNKKVVGNPGRII